MKNQKKKTVLKERFTPSVQVEFIHQFNMPPSPLSAQGAMNKQGTCAHCINAFLWGIYIEILNTSLSICTFGTK